MSETVLVPNTPLGFIKAAVETLLGQMSASDPHIRYLDAAYDDGAVRIRYRRDDGRRFEWVVDFGFPEHLNP